MSKDIAEALREAIRRSGKSANELAKATGVQQTTISRFLRGYDMRISAAAKIAAHLGIELRKSP